MNKALVEKYLNNTCTREEMEQVLSWLGNPAGPSNGKSILLGFFDQPAGEGKTHPVDSDLILNSIHHQVNRLEAEKVLSGNGKSMYRVKRRQTLWRNMRNAAAILLLPLVGSLLFLLLREQKEDTKLAAASKTYYEVTAPIDALMRVSLTDGSEIWLNRGSTLRYPAIFDTDKREVTLSGEGYFAVSHNPEVPFVVQAGEMSVVARGTEFNVMAYPDEDEISMYLANGEISLYPKADGSEAASLLTLKPAELAVFRKSARKISLTRVPDDRYSAWKDGKLVFNNESMDVVVRKLSRWFNVDILVRDPKLLDLSFTATFINESMTQVLEMMAIATPVRYSVTSRKQIGPGEFTRPVVILRSGAKESVTNTKY
jgi:ferric-dicitrate binding protein FerR (iron transport regulator)